MPRKGASVAALLSREAIRGLALPSNLRYGTAIFKRGGVQILTYSPRQVEGRVGGLKGTVVEGGSQPRRTRLFVGAGELGWHCNGNPRNHQIFCKHCVALALEVLELRARRR